MHFIEAKKGKTNKFGQEYVLMREAIGQLMTNDNWKENTIPIVSVPYSEKSHELAKRWSKIPQIKKDGYRVYVGERRWHNRMDQLQ